MNVYIKLLVAGANVGPFDLYSNVDSFATAFETGVAKASLVSGYTATDVPNETTQIKIVSTGNCTNFIILDIGIPTTTTTTLYPPTTSTTTTHATTTTTTTARPYYTIKDCNSETEYCVSTYCPPTIGDVVQYQMGYPIPSGTILCGTIEGTSVDTPVGVIYDCAPRICGETPCGIE
jgi:hypothetical protein